MKLTIPKHAKRWWKFDGEDIVYYGVMGILSIIHSDLMQDDFDSRYNKSKLTIKEQIIDYYFDAQLETYLQSIINTRKKDYKKNRLLMEKLWGK